MFATVCLDVKNTYHASDYYCYYGVSLLSSVGMQRLPNSIDLGLIIVPLVSQLPSKLN